MDTEFSKAFSEIIREQVSYKNEVEVDGLGAFRFEHQKQFQKQYKDGRVVMMPPKDMIMFIPKINEV